MFKYVTKSLSEHNIVILVLHLNRMMSLTQFPLKKNKFHIVIIKNTLVSVKLTAFKKAETRHPFLCMYSPGRTSNAVCTLAKAEHRASSLIKNNLQNKLPPLRLFHITNLF